MQFLIYLMAAILTSLTFGLGTAFLAVRDFDGFRSIESNGWVARPGSGSPDADPYEQARRARSRHVPLGAGEGLTFETWTDSKGVALDGNCSYRLVGGSLPARLWTIVVLDQNNKPMANPSNRYGLHSQQLMFDADKKFNIWLSNRPRPGNWIPTATSTKLHLLIHLYDSPIASGSDLAEVTMPVIEREDCP